MLSVKSFDEKVLVGIRGFQSSEVVGIGICVCLQVFLERTFEKMVQAARVYMLIQS